MEELLYIYSYIDIQVYCSRAHNSSYVLEWVLLKRLSRKNIQIDDKVSNWY